MEWHMPGIGKTKRGFAAMDPEKQRQIASKGGRSSHGGGRPKRSVVG
jgi:general stress protein YciG